MPGTARKMRALAKLPRRMAPESLGAARFQRAVFCILRKTLRSRATSENHFHEPSITPDDR